MTTETLQPATACYTCTSVQLQLLMQARHVEKPYRSSSNAAASVIAIVQCLTFVYEHTRIGGQPREGEADVLVHLHHLPRAARILQLCRALPLRACRAGWNADGFSALHAELDIVRRQNHDYGCTLTAAHFTLSLQQVSDMGSICTPQSRQARVKMAASPSTTQSVPRTPTASVPRRTASSAYST